MTDPAVLFVGGLVLIVTLYVFITQIAKMNSGR